MIGDRQLELLEALLEHREGLTAEALAIHAGISRSAVQQHLATLQRDGFVERHRLPSSGGRPSYAWRLSALGFERFPKQYALFSDLLIAGIKDRLGSEGLRATLADLGRQLASTYGDALRAMSDVERIAAVADIMQRLGYRARTVPAPAAGQLPQITATNCVYHHLAREYPEVCELDLALLGALLGRPVTHEECMFRGGRLCRFSLARADAADPD